MTPRERLLALLSGRPTDRLLVDVGTTTLTALRPSRAPRRGDGVAYADAVMHLQALTEAELVEIGSQTLRCGPVFAAPDFDDDSFVDRDGVGWIWADGEPAPLTHPLALSDFAGVSRHRRPSLPSISYPDALGDPQRERVVIADVPSAGLLDTAFRLRGYYELLEDTADRWPVANALFDSATDAIVRDYETMLSLLPGSPDLVAYGDDLAYQNDLYLSEERFAFFLRPRMARIFSVIRAKTSAEIVFHSCGAALPVFREAIAMGARIINFEPAAVGMDVAAVRDKVGPDIVFHGVIDFQAIARALETCEEAALRGVLRTIVAGWPMIAAPLDNLPSTMTLKDLRRVTAFLEALEVPRLLSGDLSVGAFGQAA